MAISTLIARAVVRNQLLARNYSSHVDPEQAKAALKMWRNLTCYAVPLAIGLGSVNVWLNWEEPERPEFIPYEHLRVRTKRFPWGDGNRSLFHNPHTNALPTGYEH